MSTTTTLATGLGGAIGSDFRIAQQQLVFTEFSGKLSALNLFPAATVVQSKTNFVLKGTFTLNLDTGVEGGTPATSDIQWNQETDILRNMLPLNKAKILNLGAVNYASITAANLQGLPYSTTPIVGNNNSTNLLTANDVFAVLTNKGNYAKVQVVTYGYDITINWETYHVASGYSVLGTGYSEPEDVKLSTDGVHAFVTERSGDLVKVALTSANRSAATVVAKGLTAPQQIALDEAHNAAYIVEFAPSGALVKVNLTNGVSTPVVAGLVNPVGVVVTSDLQFAYVSEQMTTAADGRISRIQLSNGARTTVATGLTAPFFLTWADPAQDAVLVPQRDPANSIVSVNVTTGLKNVIASSVAARPSSVALPNSTEMLICSNSEIDEIDFTPFGTTGDLLIGIGFIPASTVAQAAGPSQGLATTAPGAPLYVVSAPFGGSLPVMVNYQEAAAAGASFYQVMVNGVPHTDAWTNYFWNGVTSVLVTTTAKTVGPSAGCYPVHPLSELSLWDITMLGDMLDSTVLTNGVHTLQLVFLNSAGNPIPGLVSTPLIIRVNNQSCVATIADPVLETAPPVSADTCGVLHYGTNTTASVAVGFTASQPAGFGDYSTEMVRGATALSFTPPLPSGTVGSLTSTFRATVSQLLGSCPTAGFAAEIYVAATMTNGFGRQSQYDASALIAFVLTK
jgi:hypothetical protein